MSTGRWSRPAARARWYELSGFAGRPLGNSMLILGLWPTFALVREWDRYDDPIVAVAVYLGSVAVVVWLWVSGRRGIGPITSLATGAAICALNIVLILQVPAGEFFGVAFWLHSWGATVPMILAFSRPVVEPLAVLAVLTATNVFAVARAEQTVSALHNAPLHVGLPVAIAASGLALVVALRPSVVNARRSREQTAELARHERISATVERERVTRFAEWEDRIAPLLDDIAAGRCSANDPDVGARCRALAAAVRAELSAETESILQALLPETDVAVEVRDLDVGHRLVEADRIELVRLIRDVCADATGMLQVSLLPDGEPPSNVVVVLAADGPPQPDVRPGGTLTAETPTRWFYDLTLRCEAASAMGSASQVIDR